MPKVSVIIPSYNHGEFIRESVESVLRQTLHDFEVIVVDDGSTDQTKDVIAPFLTDERITYVYQVNKGLSAARNTGLRLAQGEYVKFLDSDDFIYPEQLQRQVADLEYNKSDISVTDFTSLYDNGEYEHRHTLFEVGREFDSFIESNIGPVHAFLISREKINSVGCFDESLTACEDYDLWLRLMMQGAKITKVSFVGCCYRLRKNSMSSDTDNMFRQKSRVFEKLNQALYRSFDTLNFKLLDRLYWKNVRLVHQCLARGYDLKEYFPSLIRMQTRIYHVHQRLYKKIFFDTVGFKNFYVFQYYLARRRSDSYSDRLLNEELMGRRFTHRKKFIKR